MGINPKEMGTVVTVLCVELDGSGSGVLSVGRGSWELGRRSTCGVEGSRSWEGDPHVGWKIPGVGKETHL